MACRAMARLQVFLLCSLSVTSRAKLPNITRIDPNKTWTWPRARRRRDGARRITRYRRTSASHTACSISASENRVDHTARPLPSENKLEKRSQESHRKAATQAALPHPLPHEDLLGPQVCNVEFPIVHSIRLYFRRVSPADQCECCRCDLAHYFHLPSAWTCLHPEFVRTLVCREKPH